MRTVEGPFTPPWSQSNCIRLDIISENTKLYKDSSFHFFSQVSVEPTNLIFLDGYYKNPTAPRKIEILDDEEEEEMIEETNPDLGFSHSLDYLEPPRESSVGLGSKRPLLKKRLPPSRVKGIGQTLTDIFFPNLSPKRFFKPRLPKEEPRRKMRPLMFTTPRPILTTLRAIQEKFPSILVDPFSSMRGMKKGSPIGGRRREEEEEDQEKETGGNFPYEFQRPVPLPSGGVEALSEAGRAIDRELLHPG